ncbi:MAG: hypothetical protein NZ957_05055 [Thaumarchaeota archaeon]|nr:hypothetical protein [Candidatus Calditenuaceae archaeon]MDW8042313.1 hypothetical protein [Nitrososphaerota archaeon]
MPAPEGIGRAGTLLWRAGEVASYDVHNVSSVVLRGGEPLVVSEEDTVLRPSTTVGKRAVAIFAEGQELEPGARGTRAVVFVGNVVRVKAASSVQRGSLVAAGAGGFVQVNAPSHPQNYSASASDAVALETRSVSGIALDEASSSGEEIRVVLL